VVLARLIAIAFMMLPAIIFATIAKNILTAVLTQMSGITGMSTFESALALVIPYIILVYCAIYRPIVNFWKTLSGNAPPQQGGGEQP